MEQVMTTGLSQSVYTFILGIPFDFITKGTIQKTYWSVIVP